jgi:signal peptidase I
MSSVWRKTKVLLRKLDCAITTKAGLFIAPIAISIMSIIFLPVAFAPASITSFISIFYRTIRIRGNKIKIFSVSFLIVSIATFLIRVCVAEPRYMDGYSMMPSIPNQTRVIVDKTSYLLMKPKTGDIVVFSTDKIASNGARYPSEAEPYRIHLSRVIGTPGDRLELKEGIAFVNGKPLPEAYNRNLTGFTSDEPLVLEDCQAIKKKGDVKLNLCFYLLSDDNYQDRSDDYQFRVIPAQNIIGKVRAKFWPPDRIGSI